MSLFLLLMKFKVLDIIYVIYLHQIQSKVSIIEDLISDVSFILINNKNVVEISQSVFEALRRN